MLNSSKWLLVLPTDSIQGSEHIVQSFGKFVLKKGHKCKVIILTKKHSKGWEPLEQEMEVTYFNFSSYFLGAFWLIPHLFFKNNKNITHSFSSQTIINGTLGLAKRLRVLKTHVIVRESNSIFELLGGLKLKIYSLFYHLGYKGSSLVITQTDYMKNQLVSSLPQLSKNLHIKTIPNPFNFQDINAKKAVLEPFYQNTKFLVAAGRLAPAKGFDILIDAFSRLAEQNPHLHLVILGEGPERERLDHQINGHGLKDRIHMPGYVTNVYSFFEKAEVCVLSSRIEGFPNVLLQMMSQNTAVVATLSAGGIDEIPHIYTCPTENKEALVIAIQKALKEDTTTNRPIFDAYLKARTWENFYSEMVKHLF